jgi:hypothetical protein
MDGGFDLGSLIIPEDLSENLKPMVTSTIEGILDEDDLRELAFGYGPGDVKPADEDDPSDLKKIREKHHHVARLIAGGHNQRMTAQLTGYNESYISILLNNPAMRELVELYRIQSGAAVKLATEKLATVGLKALEKLEEKIEADELNANELTSAAKLGLDRGGLGPQSKVHNINEQHVIDHAELTKLTADARNRNFEYIVPVETVRDVLEKTDKMLSAPTDDEANDEAS